MVDHVSTIFMNWNCAYIINDDNTQICLFDLHLIFSCLLLIRHKMVRLREKVLSEVYTLHKNLRM